MNAVEIEQALSELAEQAFNATEFPFQFLAAFGNRTTTLQRLRKGDSNASDVPGGVLLRNHIHLAVAERDQVGKTLAALKASPKTTRAKAKFVLATDGTTLEAEELATGDAIACDFSRFPDHFGFFLPLAGISTIKEIKDNPIDVRATGRLNKLYVELLRENSEWAKAARRPDMNHFMARLIFCFFAEDTDIFPGASLFTSTVERMSERDGSNVHEVLGTIFSAMNIKTVGRRAAGLPRWAAEFPFVNGGLFSGSTDVPRFTRTARAYLYQAGQLNWKEINPDIFGSMIQAVADDEERGALGMHYTSVPNILKVLNPLFLDDLRVQLESAGDNKIKLLNLRRRMARIRVFDPACGSGNFLVIAYKQMREIEAEINRLRGEANLASEIPIKNFRGIELRDFPAEIARLALIIAEFQCDVLYRGQKEALTDVLPLDSQNWITCGNALRLDWLAICPATGTGVRLIGDDLFGAPTGQPEIDFENEGGETYICGNPQFKGARKQNALQKTDLSKVFGGDIAHKDCDYVIGWFLKASQYSKSCSAPFAFVATNSIAQGEQVAHLWSRLFQDERQIFFAHRTFLWRNNASNNAGVHCVIVGVGPKASGVKRIYDGETVREVESISPYLIPGEERYVEAEVVPISADLPAMLSGNMARDGGNLILSQDEAEALIRASSDSRRFLRRLVGTKEINQGTLRYCLWIRDEDLSAALEIPEISERVEKVRRMREASPAKTTKAYAKIPHKFAQRCHREEPAIAVPKTTTGESAYIIPNVCTENTVISDLAFVSYPMDLVVFAIISSGLHAAWTKTVAGGMRAGLRYSSQLAYHTFPVPKLTGQNRCDLIASGKNILLVREAHFPAALAELYDSEKMPHDLRDAHDRNDEILERIYIGRRFRSDSERLEKLFELYTKMTISGRKAKQGKRK